MLFGTVLRIPHRDLLPLWLIDNKYYKKSYENIKLISIIKLALKKGLYFTIFSF